MSEHPPSHPERSGSSEESRVEKGEAIIASNETVLTPTHTAEEEARINQLRKNLSSSSDHAGNAKEVGAEVKHIEHAGGSHGHESAWMKWGVKHPIAIFSYFFSLVFQGVKRWGEMAGKGGGGGHTKASGGGHGGGHH